MARVKGAVNKSEAIREVFAEMPDLKAKEVVAHLMKKGLEVTEGLVYRVKRTSKKKKRGRKPKVLQAIAKVVAPSSNGVLSVAASITLVKETAEKVGGWSTLREIVEALQ